MGFFEGKMELYFLLCYLVIPLISCLPWFLGAKRRMWLALPLSSVLFYVTSFAFFPFYLTDIIQDTLDFTTVYWMFFVIPSQFIVSAVIIAAAYFLRRFVDKRYHSKGG